MSEYLKLLKKKKCFNCNEYKDNFAKEIKAGNLCIECYNTCTCCESKEENRNKILKYKPRDVNKTNFICDLCIDHYRKNSRKMILCKFCGKYVSKGRNLNGYKNHLTKHGLKLK